MMKHLITKPKNPIAIKLLLIAICSSIVITCLGLAVQMLLNYQSNIKNIEQRIDQIRVSTLPSITKSLWGFDEDQLKLQVKGILDAEDVIQVSINWHDWDNQPKTHIQKRSDLTEEEYLELAVNAYIIKQPLIYIDSDQHPHKLGDIQITSTLKGVYNRIGKQALFTALLQSINIIIMMLIILIAIRRLLTRHMDTITQYTRQLNLNYLNKELIIPDKPTQKYPDEIDNIVKAINNMRNNLLTDIEQRRKTEDDLLKEKEDRQQLQREADIAELSSRSKSQFLATMSHEIRTPMNGVIGMVELLKDTPLNDTQQHYLNIIYRSGETLIDIINDILDYSKIEAGKMNLENTSFNLEELIEDCVQLFGASTSKNNLDLIGSVSPTTPLRLKGDPTRLRQILINLLGNAFKFTRNGYIAIDVRREINSPIDKPLIKFSVRDTGIGIEESIVPVLFDSFNQADNSTTRKYGGTGLGLTICKRLAELMGGTIGVESTVNKGSTFWFTAQFTHADDIADSPTHDIIISTALTAKRLLIVEDNEYFCEVMYHHSLSWGMNTKTSTYGLPAIDMLVQAHNDNKPFDFIMLDLILPDINGLALAEKIRSIDSLTDLPIFIVTASDESIDADILEKLKINQVIRKPITPATLKLSLAHCLGKKPVIYLDTKLAKEELQLPPNTKILAAEDNTVNRMVIKGLLGKFGVEPIFALNGKEAMTLACDPDKHFDLIFMDCDMPVMDGFEAAREIRQHERTHNLKQTHIVALTAHALQEHRSEVINAGMNDYLAKPVTIKDLQKAFQRAGLLPNQVIQL